MQATSTTPITTTRSKFLVWTTVLCDLGIMICLIVWCAIAVDRHDYWVDECAALYEYYADQDPDPCVDIVGCGESINCRVYEKFLAGLSSTDTDSCQDNDCGGGDCYCVIAGPWKGLYISYMIFFAISMMNECFKAFSVISAALMEGCDPITYGPIEMSSLRYCMDSWTLILLRIVYPKRYEQLIRANEEGKLHMVDRFRAGQWICRDFACGLIITLYPVKIDYFNPWLVPYVVFAVIYVFCLWQRSIWLESKKPIVQAFMQPTAELQQLQQHQQQYQQPQQQKTDTVVTTTGEQIQY